MDTNQSLSKELDELMRNPSKGNTQDKSWVRGISDPYVYANSGGNVMAGSSMPLNAGANLVFTTSGSATPSVSYNAASVR